jgi:hypothetical protein
MNDKRKLYVQARVTRQEMAVIDAVARRLRRTRSDALRFLALEKAEMLGLINEETVFESSNQGV